MKNDHLDYLERMIAQEVHLRAIRSLDDFTENEQKMFLGACNDMLNSMIKAEHINQYGKLY